MKNQIGTKYTAIGNLLLTIIAILGLALSSACKKQEAKQSGPKEAITLGVAQIVTSAPIFIAQAKGYFDEEGLQVTYKSYAFGKKALEGMFAGENDIATVAETPIVFQSFVRNDFCVFATFFQSLNDAKVITRNDKGIRAPKDLKGKRIGTIEKTSAHYSAYMYLMEHKIDPANVKFSFHAPKDLPEALKNGTVDAIVAFEPYAYNSQKALPGQTTTLPQSVLFKETFNLVTMKAWAGQHPETLKKVVRALGKAVLFVQNNKEESIEILVKNAQLSKEMLDAVWDVYKFQLSLDNSMVTSLENEAQWALSNKLVEERTIPDYLDFYYLDAMKAVKPESVSIVK